MERNPKKLVKKAESALKTGLLQWSKDYVSAATYYDQAAKIYKNDGNYDEAIEVYKALTTVNEKLNDNWARAKNYENIVDCLWKKQKTAVDLNQVIDACDKAIEGFAMSNALNTLFVTMDSIAK